ncbi:MAG: 7-carboxy-7-deazaguanine synthase QueE [Bacillota bacterium]|uniref:7-carboxy-7-deazaguanine synthase QueE n=1 Tax=Desulfurispora thermophila TaxID=265470 RepID=UPI0003645F80|nr:7-carboxy-7-deazaguanine synthase QueE [Desulfurispora thermophila]
MSTGSAMVREVFSSAQGEGPLVGVRQIFLRLAGCNLHCSYCDTAGGQQTVCRYQHPLPGQDSQVVWQELPNPLAVSRVLEIIQTLDPASHHSLSVTGGEPLLWADFLCQLLPGIRGFRQGVFLETNGTLPGELAKVLSLLRWVSMDIKLPCYLGGREYWEQHEQFIRLAREKDLYVKVVVGDDAPLDQFRQAVQVVARCDRHIPLVIQPLTRGERVALSPARALQLQAMALAMLDDVRLVPQTHVFLGLL